MAVMKSKLIGPYPYKCFEPILSCVSYKFDHAKNGQLLMHNRWQWQKAIAKVTELLNWTQITYELQ